MPFASNNPPEEKYPLLLLLVDEGKGGKPQRRIFFDKNRSSGIASGATAVITQWPGHLTSCWITSIFCLIVISLIGLLAFAASIHPNHHVLKARCIGSHDNDDNRLDNRTIHLVHSPVNWHPSQLQVVEQIAHDYPDCKVHLILLENNHNKVILRKLQETEDADTSSVGQHLKKPYRIVVKRQTKRKKRKLSDLNQIKRETKKILNMLLNKKKSINATTISPTEASDTVTGTEATEIQTVEDLLEKYPDLILTRITYDEVFAHSLLHNSWKGFNEKTLMFAVRVLYLWQYGGISFDLLEATDPIDDSTTKNTTGAFTYKNLKVPEDATNDTNNSAERIISFIKLVLPTLNNIPGGMVMIDEDGMHMETGTPCHAFFGEMLMALRRAKKGTTVKEIVRKSLKMFCKQGAVDSAYCDKVKQ